MQRFHLITLIILFTLVACAPAAVATELPAVMVEIDTPTATAVLPTDTATLSITLNPTPATPIPLSENLLFSPLHMIVMESSLGEPIYRNQECIASTTTWISEILIVMRILAPDHTAYRNDVAVAVLPVVDKNKDGKIDTIEISFARPLAKGALQAVAEIPDLNDPATYTHSMIFSVNLADTGNSIMFTLWRIDEKGSYIQSGRIGEICTLNKGVSSPGGGNNNGLNPPTPTDPPIPTGNPGERMFIETESGSPFARSEQRNVEE